MQNLSKNAVFNFRTNDVRLAEARAIVEAKGQSLSSVLDNFLEQIVLTKEVNVKTKDEIEDEIFLEELRGTIQKSYSEIAEGKTKPAEEVWAKYGI